MVALAATGCLSGSVEVVVEDDGSGRAVVEVFPDSDVMDQIAGLDVASLLGPEPPGSGELELTPITGDRPGYRLELPFADAAALGTALETGLVVGDQQVTLFSSFDLVEYDYGEWRLDAVISPAGQLITSPSDQQPSADIQALLEGLRSRSPDVGFELTISLPGKVVTSNADSTSGGSATWRLDDAGESQELTMETEPAPLLTPAVAVVGGSVLVLIVGIALVAFGSARRDTSRPSRRRRSRRFPGPAPAADSWAPPAGAAPRLQPLGDAESDQGNGADPAR